MRLLMLLRGKTPHPTSCELWSFPATPVGTGPCELREVAPLNLFMWSFLRPQSISSHACANSTQVDTEGVCPLSATVPSTYSALGTWAACPPWTPAPSPQIRHTVSLCLCLPAPLQRCTVSWDNWEARLLCFPPLKGHCLLLPVTQSLHRFYLVY